MDIPESWLFGSPSKGVTSRVEDLPASSAADELEAAGDKEESGPYLFMDEGYLKY